MALTFEQQRKVDYLRQQNLFAAATQAEREYNQQSMINSPGAAAPIGASAAPAMPYAGSTPIAGPTFISAPTGVNPSEVLPGSTKPTVQGAGASEPQTNQKAIDLFNAYRPTLTQPQDNISAGVESQLQTMQPKNLEALPQQYWNNQRQNAVDTLNQQFFGPLGTAQQAASGESAAGRLGSGVGKRVIQETVTQPFAQANLQNERDIQNQQYQNQFQTQATNQAQSQQWNQFAVDTINKVRSGDQATRAAASKQLDDMTMQLISGQVHMDEAQANQIIALMDEQLKYNEQAQGMSNAPINPADPSMTAYWLQQTPEQLRQMAMSDPVHQMYFTELAKQVEQGRGGQAAQRPAPY